MADNRWLDSGCLCRPLFELPKFVTDTANPTGAPVPGPSTAAAMSPNTISQSNRVQKSRQRKSSIQVSAESLERALSDGQDARVSTPSKSVMTPSMTSPPSQEQSVQASPAAVSQPVSCCAPAVKEETLDLKARRVSEPKKEATQVVKLDQIPPAKSCCSTKAPQVKPPSAPAPAQAGSCCASKSQPNVQSAAPHSNGGPKPSDLQLEPSFTMIQERAPPWGPVPAQQEPTPPQFNHMQAPMGHGCMSGQLPFQGQVQQQMTPMDNFQTEPLLTNGNVPHFDLTEICACGDGCQCLGCATHPYNDATREHFLKLGSWMATDRPGDSPSSSGQFSPSNGQFSPRASQNGFGGQHSDLNGGANGFGAQHSDVNGGANGFGAHHSDVNGGANGHAYNGVQPTNMIFSNSNGGGYVQNGHTQFYSNGNNVTPVQLHGEYFPSAPNEFFAGPSQWQQSMIPQDAYTTVEYPIAYPCDNKFGNCLCGDDCDCVGCLTHSGHNGVPIDPNFSFDTSGPLDMSVGHGGLGVVDGANGMYNMPNGGGMNAHPSRL